VRYYRLAASDRQICIVDLRNYPGKVAEFQDMGLDVDEGMIIVLDDEIYHGEQAIHVLALLSTPIGVFNRTNHWIFSRRRLARMIYPVMVGGRNLLLLLLGRSKIQVAK
jgi:hypothetical protein